MKTENYIYNVYSANNITEFSCLMMVRAAVWLLWSRIKRYYHVSDLAQNVISSVKRDRSRTWPQTIHIHWVNSNDLHLSYYSSHWVNYPDWKYDFIALVIISDQRNSQLLGVEFVVDPNNRVGLHQHIF